MAQTSRSDKKHSRSFEALTPELSSWILDYARAMNFARTTPVQHMAIPLLMGNKDLVVEAVTGSGKTLAFLIPIVERLLKAEEPNKKGHVRSIIVAPTKELATQIHDVLKSLLEFHAPSAARLYPLKPDSDDPEDDASLPEVPSGPSIIPQLLIGGSTKLSEDLVKFSDVSPNVLVGTPKRLSEVLQSSKVILKRHLFDLLVLDEADRLLDPNFQPDLQKILDAVPKERRTGLFSASVSEAVNELVRVGMRYPFKITARVRSRSGALDKKTPESLKLYYLVAKPSHKLPILKRILEDSGSEKSIVYVSTRAGVDYWSQVLGSLMSVSVFPLHGDYKNAIRSKNLGRFRECATPAILLTTDVLARGIDLPDIDFVVQLDPPSQPKDFIHRCGRSGRAGKRGVALAFLNEGSEKDYAKYLEVQGTKLELYPSQAEISENEATAMIDRLRNLLTQKRELHDRSQRAFVSWVRAYTKTLPSDIFDLQKLDWVELGRAWGLLKWPKMPELKRYCPQAMEDRTYGLEVSPEFDLESLKYADKMREDKRQALLAAYKRGERTIPSTKAGGAVAQLRRKKENAWSDSKGAKALRDARRERKTGKRRAEKVGRMSDVERLKAMELDDLVAKVRAQNVAREGDFEGFGE